MPDRQFVKYTFLKVDPAWRRLDAEERARHKREFIAACEDFATDRSLRAYSTVGTRGDTDLMLLSQSPVLEDIHTFHVVLAQSGLAKWATIPHSYLAMTKPSPYSESQARAEICTSERKYCIVYPLDKKREWYTLPVEERQRTVGVEREGRRLRSLLSGEDVAGGQRIADEDGMHGRDVDGHAARRVTPASRSTNRVKPGRPYAASRTTSRGRISCVLAATRSRT